MSKKTKYDTKRDFALQQAFRAVWTSRHGGEITPYDLTPEQLAGRAGTEMEAAQRQMEREIEKAINVYVFALAGVNFYAGGE